MVVLFFSFIFSCCISSVYNHVTISDDDYDILIRAPLPPSDIARAVIPPVFANPKSFLQWDYGGAIIVDSFWEFIRQFDLQSVLLPPLEAFLNGELTDPTKDGYKILHDVPIPFGSAVGDTVALFPIALLSRALYYRANPSPSYSNASDIKIVQKVISNYILKWPYHLSDGTFSRTHGWDSEPPGNQFVWDDDDYMGLCLIARASVIFNTLSYAHIAANMQLTYFQHLSDPSDGLFWHGFNAANSHHSCCKWGRGNGWLMMAHVETLIALDHFEDPLFYHVLGVLTAHAEGVLNVQSTDGRWHQVLNDTSTYLETSASAMYLWSFVEAVMRGWLPRRAYEVAIEKAWLGLTKAINGDGTVTGITEGTGIGPSAGWYNQRTTDYLGSSPGLGSVFKAITSYARYKQY